MRVKKNGEWIPYTGDPLPWADLRDNHPWLTDIEEYAKLLSGVIELPHYPEDCQICKKALDAKIEFFILSVPQEVRDNINRFKRPTLDKSLKEMGY